MNLRQQLEQLPTIVPGGGETRETLTLPTGQRVEVAVPSICWTGGGALMVVREAGRRRLLVVELVESGLAAPFHGDRWITEAGLEACFCELDHHNATAVRNAVDTARPQPLGLADSFGLGDRLGIAGPAHLRSMRGSGFKAQRALCQSLLLLVRRFAPRW